MTALFLGISCYAAWVQMYTEEEYKALRLQELVFLVLPSSQTFPPVAHGPPAVAVVEHLRNL